MKPPLGKASDWITANVFVPETKRYLELAPYQRAMLDIALPDDSGNAPYSVIVWSDIKKSIKSTIAAAVALWRAYQVDNDTGYGQIFVIANDLKQADSRVGYYLRRAIELNPKLRAECTVRNYRITLPGGTYIESIPIDPTGEAGSNADMVVFSELWGAHSKSQERMWTEMTTPPAKFGRSFRWVETYAGFSGESPLLERLYENGVVHGQPVHPDWPITRNGRLLCLWNDTPRLPWQSPEYYAQQETELLPNEFLRVHRNQWVSSLEKFVDMILYDGCLETLPPLDATEPIVLVADAGVKNDSFGLVAVSRHPSRRDDAVAVRFASEFKPPPRDPRGLDFAEPEARIRDLCARYNVVQFAYDPYQLHDMGTRLQREGVVMTSEFPQGAPRLEADKALRDVITQRRLAHDGNAALRAHIDHADADVNKEDRRLRIIKRADHLKIDLAVALSMAVYRCLKLPL